MMGPKMDGLTGPMTSFSRALLVAHVEPWLKWSKLVENHCRCSGFRTRVSGFPIARFLCRVNPEDRTESTRRSTPEMQEWVVQDLFASLKLSFAWLTLGTFRPNPRVGAGVEPRWFNTLPFFSPSDVNFHRENTMNQWISGYLIFKQTQIIGFQMLKS